MKNEGYKGGYVLMFQIKLNKIFYLYKKNIGIWKVILNLILQNHP